jgi:predicted Ser/Thr protein kinase
MHLVNVFKSASRHYGTERRILLLHGPVGSAKSTIVRLLKKGLEAYSRKPEGALYSFSWHFPDADKGQINEPCPMHEDPLNLLPSAVREPLIQSLNTKINGRTKIAVDGDLCPSCRFYYRTLMQRYSGDLKKVLDHVRVYRLILSEQDRIGIGTFQPKDEKNQDSTELTGDINYRKIALYGSDSDPRAFNFDGEFNVANRGLIEFVEVLKLDVAFLYDLLCASQEHVIKPKKFPQTYIDEVIIGHTNEPEYKKLQNNEFMEALRDRTVKVDVPYITRLSDEVKIYEKDYGAGETYRPPHHRNGRHVGGADPVEGTQKSESEPAPETEALQRKDSPRLHRGEHQRTEGRGGAGGDGGHISPVHSGQDLQRPRIGGGRGVRESFHRPQRTGIRAGPPQPGHRGGAEEAVPGADDGGQG